MRWILFSYRTQTDGHYKYVRSEYGWICWVIIWCCSHFYYSYSVFLLGLTNNNVERFFASPADGRFNCHPLLVYESSYGSILVSSHNWRNLVSEPDQGKQGNTETGQSSRLLSSVRFYWNYSTQWSQFNTLIGFPPRYLCIMCKLWYSYQDQGTSHCLWITA